MRWVGTVHLVVSKSDPTCRGSCDATAYIAWWKEQFARGCDLISCILSTMAALALSSAALGFAPTAALTPSTTARAVAPVMETISDLEVLAPKLNPKVGKQTNLICCPIAPGGFIGRHAGAVTERALVGTARLSSACAALGCRTASLLRDLGQGAAKYGLHSEPHRSPAHRAVTQASTTRWVSPRPICGAQASRRRSASFATPRSSTDALPCLRSSATACRRTASTGRGP